MSSSGIRLPSHFSVRGRPHLRIYGTFPRYEYVRRRRSLTLEGAIRKMTSLPAEKLKLRDWGLIREGLWADITVYDQRAIMDKATYPKQHIYPVGIEYVIVTGKW